MTPLSPVNPLPSGPTAASPALPVEPGGVDLPPSDELLAFPGLLDILAELALPLGASEADSSAAEAATESTAGSTTANPAAQPMTVSQMAAIAPLTGAMMQPLRVVNFEPPAAGANAGLPGSPGGRLAPAAAIAGAPGANVPTMPVGNGNQADAAIAPFPHEADAAQAARTFAAVRLQDEMKSRITEAAADRPAGELAIEGIAVSATRSLRSTNGEGLPVASLKLPSGNPEQWRPTLLEALGERLQVAVGKQGEHAVIRLDPPMMGSIEVVVRHQAGSLQVHINASHSEVVRQLQSIGDSLRQDLVHGPYTDVSVHVQADARNGGKQPEQQDEATPGQALAEADEGLADQSFALENA